MWVFPIAMKKHKKKHKKKRKKKGEGGPHDSSLTRSSTSLMSRVDHWSLCTNSSECKRWMICLQSSSMTVYSMSYITNGQVILLHSTGSISSVVWNLKKKKSIKSQKKTEKKKKKLVSSFLMTNELIFMLVTLTWLVDWSGARRVIWRVICLILAAEPRERINLNNVQEKSWRFVTLLGRTTLQCWRSWLSRWSATWPFVIHFMRTPCREWNEPVASSLWFGWWPSSVPYLSLCTQGSSTPTSNIREEVTWYRNRRFALCSTRIDRPSGRSTKYLPSFSSLFPWWCCACSTFASASASGALRSDAVPTISRAQFIAATAKPITVTPAAISSACSVLHSLLQNYDTFFSLWYLSLPRYLSLTSFFSVKAISPNHIPLHYQSSSISHFYF